MLNGAAAHWLAYTLRFRAARSQTTAAERACLARFAAGRRTLVEIGVMHGVSTAVLRRAMSPDGVLTAIDPHPRGRLGISFERLVARREIARSRGGRVVLDRRLSVEVARSWRKPIDFLFIDGDHSWPGIDIDWQSWSPWLMTGSVVALHDSQPSIEPSSVNLESVEYSRQVIFRDPRFRLVTVVDTLTVLERGNGGPPAIEDVA